jgi:hypothetical protein
LRNLADEEGNVSTGVYISELNNGRACLLPDIGASIGVWCCRLVPGLAWGGSPLGEFVRDGHFVLVLPVVR